MPDAAVDHALVEHSPVQIVPSVVVMLADVEGAGGRLQVEQTCFEMGQKQVLTAQLLIQLGIQDPYTKLV